MGEKAKEILKLQFDKRLRLCTSTNWTRLSCHRFVANQARLQLFILVYNLGNFMRRLGLPKAVKDWSLRSLQVKLIKMGGRMELKHSDYSNQKKQYDNSYQYCLEF